ncbi:MAG: CU044_2847 family protein [Cyanobacteria bacterium P01_G01_bin.54]
MSEENVRPTEPIPVELGDGVSMIVETTLLGGEEDVGLDAKTFEPVFNAVKALSGKVQEALETAKPDKVSLELGLEVGLKEGQLVAMLVQNSTKANLKLTLEWGKS